jgi:hypothetical protein
MRTRARAPHAKKQLADMVNGEETWSLTPCSTTRRESFDESKGVRFFPPVRFSGPPV